MRKHTLIHLLSLAVFVCLLVSTASAAIAPADEIVQPRLERISNFSANIDITALGQAQCGSSVRLRSSTDTVTLTMELQRSSNGSSWTTIKSWSTTGSNIVTLDQSWYVNTSGYSHRVVATANVYNSAGTFVESVTATSAVV